MSSNSRTERGLATQMDPITHVKMRPSVYIGSKTPEYIKMWLFSEDGKFVYIPVRVAPGFFKIIDEIIVNAIDQHIIFPKEVTEIKIDLLEDGSISVANNGRGFNLQKKTRTLDGTEVWNPELCAGYMLTSDNYDDSSNRITGGMNGIGMKATNIFSKKFKLITQDGGLVFKQEFRNNLTERDVPVIKKSGSSGSYTKIAFLPDYEFFTHAFEDGFKMTVRNLLYTRAFQSAAFTGIKITCIGTSIEINFENFCKMHILKENESKLAVIKLRETGPAFLNDDREIEVGFSFSTTGAAASVLLVNGIHCYSGGTLIESIRQQITIKLRPLIVKMIEKRFGSIDAVNIDNKKIHDCTFIFIMGQVDKPEFDSQAKAILKTDKKRFKNYILPDEFLKKCWDILKDIIYDLCMASIRKKIISASPKKTIHIDNYEPARLKKDRTRASLFIVEGLSAAGSLSNAIAKTKITKLSNEFYGIFPIIGVPINAIKKVNDEKDEHNASTVQNLQRALKSPRFSELIQILGLRADAHYDLTPEGNEQYSKLNYGKIIIVTDQDLDGHNIAGMCSCNLLTFWPYLLKRQFIRKLNTPIIRAWFGKKAALSFYSIQDYNSWAADSPKHSVKYYKGLGSSKESESIEMFSNIDGKLIKLAGDEKTFSMFNNYYGKNANIRKTILVEKHSDRALTIESTMTEFLETDVHMYQRYNVARKVPSVFDGCTLAKRKAIYTALGEMKEKEMKVVQLTGLVISHAAYHHGDASMSDTIIKMAQHFPGSKVLPIFMPEGQVGSFKKGGNDRAQPRYVSVKLNSKMMLLNFPKEDEYVLDYEFDEGERHEPMTYYTVIPNCIMEYIHIPATGWSCKIIPRNHSEVLDSLIGLLSGEIEAIQQRFPLYNYNNSKIILKNDEEFASEGEYKWDAQKGELNVSRMPLYAFPGLHAQAISKMEEKDMKRNTYLNADFHNDKPNDSSDNDHTDLTYYLNKKGRDHVRNLKDDWESKFFQMFTYLKPNINFLAVDKSVKSFATYEQAFMFWFAGRKEIYAKRLVRQSIVAKMQILRLDNIIRFIQSVRDFGDMSRLKEEELNGKLHEMNYLQLNENLVANPGFIPVDEIEAACLNKDANYKYISHMSIISLTEERCKKFIALRETAKIRKLEIEDDFEDGFIGRKSWLREVREIKKILDVKIPRFWN